MSNTHLELINPPVDVQESYSAFVHACQNWQPTAVPNLPISQSPLPPTTDLPSVAGLCLQIQNPDHMFWVILSVFLIFFITIIAFFWATKLHRLPGWLIRLLWRAALKTSFMRGFQ